MFQTRHLRCPLARPWKRWPTPSSLWPGGKGKGKGMGKTGGHLAHGSGKGGLPAGAAHGGKLGGKGGKAAGSKGDASSGAPNAGFNGTCNHCGKYGHRKQHCRLLDAEMAKLRGLNNVEEGTPDTSGGPESALTMDGDEAPAQEDQDDVWWMGSAYALSHDIFIEDQSHEAQGSSDCSMGIEIPLENRFSCLATVDEDEEEAKAEVPCPEHPCQGGAEAEGGADFERIGKAYTRCPSC